MNFKRKAGAAVLAIAAASAIAVPGVAMADVETPSVVVFASDGVAADAGTFDNSAFTTGMTAAQKNTIIAAATSLEISADATEEDVEAALAMAPLLKTVTTVAGGNYNIEKIDFSTNDDICSINLLMPNLVTIDGLDNIVAGEDELGHVTITSSDLESLDFGENDVITNVTLNVDLESISFSGMKAMTDLNLTGCSDLESIDLTDCDDLENIIISGTKLAAFDTTDSDYKVDASETGANNTGVNIISRNSTDTADEAVSIDSQYATKTVNSDDDDYDDYTFDMDSITGGLGEFVVEDGFKVEFDDEATVDGPQSNSLFDEGNDDDLDFTDGVLTISSDAAPTAITYTVDTNSKTTIDATYEVTFDADNEGDRISGSDRYDTMVQIDTDGDNEDFDSTFADNTEDGNIVVASGAGYADALSASALAGSLSTGIVTTAVDSLTDDTIDMLDDMTNQGTAYIAGGTSAVSYAVEQQLTDLGFKIKRFAGSDRFDTAVKVQDFVNTDVNETVIIASGVNYADALAIAPYSYTQSMPIVLVGADGQMDDDTAALFNKYKKDYSKAIVVGGTAVVSDDVIDTLQGYDMDVIRLAGADRFETNLVINDWLDHGTSNIGTSDDIFTAAGYSKDDIKDFNDEDIDAGATADGNSFDKTAYVVTGMGYADALAVAPLAGTNHGTINMVSDTDIRTVTEAKDNNADTTIIGGTAAVSEDLADTIEAL